MPVKNLLKEQDYWSHDRELGKQSGVSSSGPYCLFIVSWHGETKHFYKPGQDEPVCHRLISYASIDNYHISPYINTPSPLWFPNSENSCILVCS